MDETNSQTNSAGRLLLIFERAKETNLNESVLKAFRNIFGIEGKESDEEVFRQLSVSADIARDLTHQLAALGNAKVERTYRNCLPEILNVLRPHNFDIKWNDHRPRLTDREIIALQLASEVLTRTSNEAPLDRNDLDSLQASVDELYQDVVDSDLDSTLKKISLDNLHRIKTAIHDYHLRGAEGLAEAFASAVGSTVLYKPLKEKGPLLEKWMRLMDALKKTLETARLYAPYLPVAYEYVKQLLPVDLGGK